MWTPRLASDGEFRFMLIEDSFDLIFRGVLTLSSDDGETLGLHFFVHLDQMGHGANAGSSLDSPLFNDDNSAFESIHFDFFTKKVISDFPLGEFVIREFPILCGRLRHRQSKDDEATNNDQFHKVPHF